MNKYNFKKNHPDPDPLPSKERERICRVLPSREREKKIASPLKERKNEKESRNSLIRHSRNLLSGIQRSFNTVDL